MEKAIIYTRQSDKEKAKKGYSMDAQEEACRDWCRENGYEIVECQWPRRSPH
jgi:DNA invertase Pin-like site-specific DNA recombinase